MRREREKKDDSPNGVLLGDRPGRMRDVGSHIRACCLPGPTEKVQETGGSDPRNKRYMKALQASLKQGRTLHASRYVAMWTVPWSLWYTWFYQEGMRSVGGCR